MTEPNERHTPTPEFRASLQRDISRELRRAHFATYHVPRAWRWTRVLAVAAGTVVALGIGLVLGTNTGYASARIEGKQQRNDLAGTVSSVSAQLSALRQDLARARTELARRAEATGTMSQASLLASVEDLRALETSAARIEFDLMQGRESAVVQQSMLLGNVPMKRALSLTCSALSLNNPVVSAPAAATPTTIPVVELPDAIARTTEPMGNVLSVRQTSEGKVLASDGTRRQLFLFDSLFQNASVVIDSMPGTANPYGPYGTTLLAYRGDSTLFPPSNRTRGFYVLDGEGQVARTMSFAIDTSTSLPFLSAKGASGVDSKGRVVYRNTQSTTIMHSNTGTGLYLHQPSDTVEILRADLEARRIDTLGFVLQPQNQRLGQTLGADGRAVLKQTFNPLVTIDEWALLSNGTVAFIRGADYHVDWLHPDGTTSVGPKLPFEWRRVTEEDKRALIDSVRGVQTMIAVRATLNAARFAISADGGRGDTPGARVGGGRGARVGDGADEPGMRVGGGARVGGGEPSARVGGAGPGARVGGAGMGGAGGRGGAAGPAPMPYDFVSLDQIANYYPPIRRGAVIPDNDGNVWILPTTSTAARSGELVYDVVNERQGLFERVRMPAGRSVIGFGKDLTVFLLSGDRTNGFTIERTTLPVQRSATATTSGGKK